MGAKTGVLLIKKEFKMPARAKVYARKPAPLTAIQIDVEFNLEEAGGTRGGNPGDYLILRSEGNFGIIDKDYFEKNYEAITIGGRK